MSYSVDEQLDAIYDFCDKMMWNDDLTTINLVCENWPVESTLDQVLGILTATLPARYNLPARDELLAQAKVKFGEEDGLFDGL